MAAIEYEVLELGDLPLARGEVLRGARPAYATCGALNAARDNCIVFPTYYTGTHRSNARTIAPHDAAQEFHNGRTRIRRDRHDYLPRASSAPAAGNLPARRLPR